jgi:hypothetical protein
MTFVVKSALLLFLSCLLVAPSHANPALLNHAQAAFQAMTAMYMKALSQGSPKYQTDLDKYKKEAIESLLVFQKADSMKGGELLSRWNTFADELKAEYSPEYDWDVDSVVRREARSYLSDLYTYIATNSNIQESQNQALVAQVEVQAITARFFDVSSSYNGTISLSPQDAAKLEPKAASKKFKARLDALVKSSRRDAYSKRITSAKEKWEFVEDSVVNYSDQSAFFLVYATKNKIAKVLQSVSASVAVGNI